MNYEAHRKSAENLSSAETSLETARRKLEAAEKYRAEALAEYERILEEGTKEVTPELITKAYEEYKLILEERVARLIREGNYMEAKELLEELDGLKKGYGEADESAAEWETPTHEEISILLNEYGIKEPFLREHYFNRAGYLRGLGRSKREILGAIKKEITTPVKKRIIKFPWTGH